MPRYALQFAYNGTPFYGWQAQAGLKTVQGDLEQAMGWVFRQPVTLMAAGRTDRGVHAEGQVAHFDFPEKLENPAFLLRRINSILFPFIVAKQLREVPDDFHARFSAVARQYRYELATVPDPLRHETLAIYYVELDPELLHTMAHKLIGTHDLSGFSKESEQHLRTDCVVMETNWEQKTPHHWIFRVKANRFLHHTVRGMVGTMMAVASGKKTMDEFDVVLNECRRDRCGATALAKGLVLEKIFFKEDVF